MHNFLLYTLAHLLLPDGQFSIRRSIPDQKHDSAIERTAIAGRDIWRAARALIALTILDLVWISACFYQL
ncbi:hypothetical protein J6590_037668 [Homalodisca vitripennis]|nr:hypothetical protein J6590_037668 [Homalodisca vitripennis]